MHPRVDRRQMMRIIESTLANGKSYCAHVYS
jgi:hypothetical protein